MSELILISFGADLPTRNQNLLRLRMEYKIWAEQREDAMTRDDNETLDRLDQEYEFWKHI